jgi:hypothetical protein
MSAHSIGHSKVSAIQKYRPQKTIGYKNQFGKVFVTEYLCSNIQLV